MSGSPYLSAMLEAVDLASQFRGQTSPNPCVGAAALDRNGRLLGVAAHERAGEGHAEVQLIAKLKAAQQLDRVDTFLVTLEPCNHYGKTPPCAEALVELKPRKVVMALRDPNREAAGGLERLEAAGIEVETGVAEAEARRLLAPFFKRIRFGLPWVTIKTAHWPGGSMEPENDQTTFTREPSLRLAHRLRKRAGGILTGSGMVLADDPKFTVRKVEDFENIRRQILVLDRRQRVPSTWVEARQADGFDVTRLGDESLEKRLRKLADQGVSDVLVEAGPGVTELVNQCGLWDEWIRITRHESRDTVMNELNPHSDVVRWMVGGDL